jgi:hypothetical protein
MPLSGQEGRQDMKNKMLATMILAGGALFAQTGFAQSRLSIGVGIGGVGGYYDQGPGYASIPPSPGPEYIWADGYWAPDGIWVPGYWYLPSYSNGYYGSGYYGPSYYGGVGGYYGRSYYSVRPRVEGRYDRDDHRGVDRERGNNFRGGDNRVDSRSRGSNQVQQRNFSNQGQSQGQRQVQSQPQSQSRGGSSQSQQRSSGASQSQSRGGGNRSGGHR